MSKGQKTTRFKNIDELVRGGGDITVGRIGPVRCAAVAADGDQQLEDLLDRLDTAIAKAWDDEEYIEVCHVERGATRLITAR